MLLYPEPARLLLVAQLAGKGFVVLPHVRTVLSLLCDNSIFLIFTKLARG